MVRIVSWAGMILLICGVLVIVLLKAGSEALRWGCGGMLVGSVLVAASLVLAAREISARSKNTEELFEKTLNRFQREYPAKDAAKEPPKDPPPATPS